MGHLRKIEGILLLQDIPEILGDIRHVIEGSGVGLIEPAENLFASVLALSKTEHIIGQFL
jgi:hypothetical protein